MVEAKEKERKTKIEAIKKKKFEEMKAKMKKVQLSVSEGVQEEEKCQ